MSHAATLRAWVQLLDTTLCHPPAAILVLKLVKDHLVDMMPAPLEWVTDIEPFKPVIKYLDHPPDLTKDGNYIVFESKISPYLTRYEDSSIATAENLLWDMAVATVWLRVQCQALDRHSLNYFHAILHPAIVEKLASQFCSVPSGAIVEASLMQYYQHMDHYGSVYEDFSHARYPNDEERQQQSIDLLCIRDTETKSVSNAATYIRRHRGQEVAVQFLLRCREVFRQKI